MLALFFSAGSLVAQEDPAAGLDHRFVDVGDVRLEYFQFGDAGTPIVLIQDHHDYFHAAFGPDEGGELQAWIDFLDELGRDHRVVAPVRRGWGESDAPGHGYDVATQAEDVLGVMDALGVDRAVLVGRTLATQEMTWIAEHHPERVRGLVYWGTPMGHMPDSEPTPEVTRFHEMYNRRACDIAGGRGAEIDARLEPRRSWRPHFVRDESRRFEIPTILLLHPFFDRVSMTSRRLDRIEAWAPDDFGDPDGWCDEEAKAYFTELHGDSDRIASLRQAFARVDAQSRTQEAMGRAFGSHLVVVWEGEQTDDSGLANLTSAIQDAVRSWSGNGTPPIPESVATESVLVLQGVSVIDASSETARLDQTVVIVGDEIQDIFPSGSKDLPVGAEVLELPGRFLTPGLIDGHQHFSLASPERRLARLKFLLEGGITSLRDPSGDARLLAYLALQSHRGEIAAPHMVYAAVMGGPGFAGYGPVEAISDGYALGRAPWAREVGDTTDLRRVMIEASAAGARGVKMYRYLSPDLTRRVAEAAHAEGLLVWSHTRIRGHNGSDEWATRPADVVASGADVLSHAGHMACQVMPCRSGEERSRAVATVPPDHPEIRAVLRDMAERGTILDPTLVNAEVGNEEAYWLRFASAVTGLAAEMGVPIMAGPDIPDDPDEQEYPLLHRELELLVSEAGLSPWEALVAATATAARGIGEEGRRGMVRPGMKADLVVLESDPLDDIRALRTPAMVIKGGRVVFQGL